MIIQTTNTTNDEQYLKDLIKQLGEKSVMSIKESHKYIFQDDDNEILTKYMLNILKNNNN